jgi:ChrR Cupin-like domain
MLPEGDNERLLVKYLLGDATEDEQILVEDRALADTRYRAELEAAEADLIDAYVRGELARSERHAFELRFLMSPHRRSKVEFARALAILPVDSKAPHASGSRLRSRGWRQMLADAPTVFSSSALARVDELVWESTPFEGIDAKILLFDTSTGTMTSLLRMRPGASYPAHRHAADERTYVLEGDVQFGGHVLYAGDYEVAGGDSYHSAVTTRGGCLVLLMSNVADQVLL